MFMQITFLVAHLSITFRIFISSGTWKLKQIFPTAKSVISAASTAKADVHLQELDKVTFGERFLSTILTPGHTQGCASYLLDDGSMVFTGDALLVRGCGRTDFQVKYMSADCATTLCLTNMCSGRIFRATLSQRNIKTLHLVTIHAGLSCT